MSSSKVFNVRTRACHAALPLLSCNATQQDSFTSHQCRREAQKIYNNKLREKMEPNRTQLYPAGASRTNGVDRVFNYLENNHQESTLLEKQIYEHQQQHRRYKSQISTYEARIRHFEKDLAKRDEDKQSLKGQVRLLHDHVKSLMFEKANLSNTNATLETKLEQFESKIVLLNKKWLKVGESISSKVSNYLKAFDFDKICKQVVDDSVDLQKVNELNSSQGSGNDKVFDGMSHAREQSNSKAVDNTCDGLPKTYIKLKAKYITLDGQYKSLYKHYEELSREYEKVIKQFAVAYKNESTVENNVDEINSTDTSDKIPNDKSIGLKQDMEIEGRTTDETGNESTTATENT